MEPSSRIERRIGFWPIRTKLAYRSCGFGRCRCLGCVLDFGRTSCSFSCGKYALGVMVRSFPRGVWEFWSSGVRNALKVRLWFSSLSLMTGGGKGTLHICFIITITLVVVQAKLPSSISCWIDAK